MDNPQHNTPQQLEPAPLRPSVALIVISVINMVIAAVAASVSMVVLELLWPHSLSYNALLLLAWALLTIIAQYLGTFHQNSHGAWLSVWGSSLCCAMLHLAIVILHLIDIDSNEPISTEIWGREQSVVWTIIGMLTIASLWFNGRWAWKLKKFSEQNPTKKRLVVSLREIMALCVVLGLIMIPATYRAHANQSVYRANVAVADAPFSVPDAAQAITYERDRSGLLLASYEMQEAPFRAWLSNHDSVVSKNDGRWEELASAVNATSPSPNRLPWILSYGNEMIADGFRVIWQADGLYHFIIYDRTIGVAYYEQQPIPE
ncbi:hypothetical protein C5Y96_11255 [Blastopirellula marina]|uniref:Uncharacterized protein n=1 Tax=Blastopirellula marina TaxID=124 RepID=A0A2S8FMK3_9BACT|nr:MULTISPECIES: hypothetical protein [Pirellulaceae]PQO33415.1 hypothetical protein C5Y96_11255 [Blastopirellula marina]RCS52505.1 hypothetical protein DTL36_11265 [Bremerella cremea]